jgi:hypothetical protein
MNILNPIDQLNRRVDVLRRVGVASFGETFRRFQHFLKASPVFKPIYDEIVEKHPNSEILFRSLIHKSQFYDFADLPQDQLAAVAICALSELSDVSKVRGYWGTKYASLSGRGSDASKQLEIDTGALQLAKDFLLEPLHDFLLERVETQRLTLYHLSRYRQLCEWFDKEELLLKYNEKPNIGETVLKTSLHKYLFLNNIDFLLIQVCLRIAQI